MLSDLTIWKIAFFIFLQIMLFLVGYYTFPWLWGRYQRKILNNKTISGKTIILTLDDGPGERLTPVILDILAEAGVKATFFLLGRNIVGHEKIVQQIAAEGHEICSHGFDHLNAWRVWPWKSIQDIQKGWETINQTLGTHNEIYSYRPPYGKLNLVVLLYLWYKHVPIIYWTVDSQETWDRKGTLPSYELLSKKMSKSCVLIVHDFDRPSDEYDQYVIDICKLVINVAQNKNLRICTLSQLNHPPSL